MTVPVDAFARAAARGELQEINCAREDSTIEAPIRLCLEDSTARTSLLAALHICCSRCGSFESLVLLPEKASARPFAPGSDYEARIDLVFDCACKRGTPSAWVEVKGPSANPNCKDSVGQCQLGGPITQGARFDRPSGVMLTPSGRSVLWYAQDNGVCNEHEGWGTRSYSDLCTVLEQDESTALALGLARVLRAVEKSETRGAPGDLGDVVAADVGVEGVRRVHNDRRRMGSVAARLASSAGPAIDRDKYLGFRTKDGGWWGFDKALGGLVTYRVGATRAPALVVAHWDDLEDGKSADVVRLELPVTWQDARDAAIDINGYVAHLVKTLWECGIADDGTAAN